MSFKRSDNKKPVKSVKRPRSPARPKMASCGVPILQLHGKDGKSNNLDEVTRELSLYCQKEFGTKLGGIIESRAEPEYNYIVIAQNAPAIRRLRDEKANELNATMEAKDNLARPALYNVIMSVLSEQSAAKASEHAAYAEAAAAKDPVELWKIVYASHQAGGMGVDDAGRYKVRQDYASLRMREDEELMAFHTRFIRAVQAHEIVGLQAPAQSEQARHFINSLHRKSYGDFAVSIENMAAIGGVAYPNTLQVAYTKAQSFRPSRAQSNNSKIT